MESGTTVLLTATPATGSAFDGWSGDCSGRQTCQLVLDGNKTVASMFASTRLQPSLSLTASPVKASLGSSILLTSLLKKTSNSSPRPSGTIVFRDGTRTIFTGNLNSTLRNTSSLKSLDAGSHSITASYSGDSLYASAESSAVKVEILPLSTRTVLSAKPTTLKSTAKLTLSASVTPARTSQWTPAGQVTFYQGSKVLGSGTISSGKATLELQLAKGIYAITARYEGDARYTGSTSSSVRITVTP